MISARSVERSTFFYGTFQCYLKGNGVLCIILNLTVIAVVVCSFRGERSGGRRTYSDTGDELLMSGDVRCQYQLFGALSERLPATKTRLSHSQN